MAERLAADLAAAQAAREADDAATAEERAKAHRQARERHYAYSHARQADGAVRLALHRAEEAGMDATGLREAVRGLGAFLDRYHPDGLEG